MKKTLYRILLWICITLCACQPQLYRLLSETSTAWKVVLGIVLVVGTIWFAIKPSFSHDQLEIKRLTTLDNGIELLIQFLIAACVTVGLFFWNLFRVWLPAWSGWRSFLGTIIWDALIPILVLGFIFWCGITRVYVSSEQLGIRYRVWGVLLGMIPVAHLVMLGIILKVCADEVNFEQARLVKERERRELRICETKYPILMVHGVFFRDFRALNYWGRIPEALQNNGAKIYYGEQESAASIAFCGTQLVKRIEQIVKETGCEKVNIIAHSKGGLDSRAAIKLMGEHPLVASLTTINTPHRGCIFADYLLEKIPERIKEEVASAYNKALYAVGDNHPDFIEAVTDLTASSLEKFNATTPDSPEVFYQSVGSKISHAVNGRFPLNYSYHIVKHFDGNNDGLVGEESFPWGEHYQFLTPKGNRGISHADMIDLNRENIPGFDVREFYIQLVADLKRRGF